MRQTALALLLLTGAFTLRESAAAAEDAAASSLTQDPTQVRAGRYVLDPDHAKITWSLNHLGFSTYYGQFSGITGEATLDPREPAKSRLSVTIPAAGVGTSNEALNRALLAPEFLDAQAFPRATYVSTSVEPTSPTTARVNGELTIKGITRTVSFDATFNQAGTNPIDSRYSVGFDGRATIRRSDFSVSAYLPMLGDEVALRLAGEFKAAE